MFCKPVVNRVPIGLFLSHALQKVHCERAIPLFVVGIEVTDDYWVMTWFEELKEVGYHTSAAGRGKIVQCERAGVQVDVDDEK